MAVLLWGVVLLLVGLTLHVVIWRISKPRRSINALLLIFLAVAVIGLTALYAGGGALAWAGLAVLSGPASYAHVLLFYTSMAFAYIVSYTLLEWDSPTLTLVLMMASAGEEGLGEADLLGCADKLPFIESRIESLILDRTIVERGGRYVVSPGCFNYYFFRFVLCYGRLLGLDARAG
jgi:hypothetical protein